MDAVRARLSDPANMGEARTELRSIIAYVEVDRVGSRDPISLTVWSHFGRLFTREVLATPSQIEGMETAVRAVANGASEESIALVSLIQRQPRRPSCSAKPPVPW
jgi:hypothetical protein